jgi:hypothetical protein
VYSTCLFCHSSLGANEVIEHLPIGRRLAFDGAQGRLWVVCGACRRWNLTPIEERWEAIEACERHYRTARVRASTDEIGLARLPEGLELVRIGKPPRTELAAWRYEDAFRRRRQRAIVAGAASVVGLAGLIAGGYAMIGTGTLTSILIHGYTLMRNRRVVHRIVGPYGARIDLQEGWLGDAVRWVRSGDGGPLTIDVRRGESKRAPYAVLTGEAAERALRPILAHMNRYAGRPDVIQQAVRRLNAAGDPLVSGAGGAIPLFRLNAVDRLAMEMSLAEREEQKLLAGELASLTLAWREAEEVAAIADNLLLPESVTAWLRRQKRKDS